MQNHHQSTINRRRFLQFSAGVGFAAVLGPARFAGAFQADAETALKVLTETPKNAEPSLEDLMGDWITPNKFFYIRSHGPNPQIDPASFRLKIEGLVEKPLELSLEELNQRFKRQDVTATLTCAGNRRDEYNEIKKVGGVQWGPGAIGNAEWTGVRLSDVLKAAGLKEDAKHVWFEGLDEIPEGNGTIPFGGSIPVTKALADTDQTPAALLCDRMNGEPLTADHGFPLRSVVPGYIGARSVKWLGKITVSNRPSPNHYVAEAYKLITEETPLTLDEAPIIYHYQVNSAIAEPKSNATIPTGMVKARGYALPNGNGGPIAKVEVSGDDGKSWTKAKLLTKSQPLCWVLWEADVPVKSSTRQLIARATDSQGNTQPQTVPWNLKGYMNNAWYDLPIRVQG